MKSSPPNTVHRLVPLVLCGLLWVCTPFFSSAQTLPFQHFTTDDGLANLTVYSSLQDDEGYIWFGTESGASRFDGHNFQTYTTAEGLTGNDILEIGMDGKGRIWFFPFKSKPCYLKGQEVVPFLDIPGAEGLLMSETFRDRAGKLWISAVEGDSPGRLYILPREGGLIEFGDTLQKLINLQYPSIVSHQMFHRGDNEWIIVLNCGYISLTPELVTIYTWKALDNLKKTWHNLFPRRAVSLANGDFIYYHGSTGFFKESPTDKEKPEILAAPDFTLSSMLIDRDSILWVGTNKGLLELDITGDHFSIRDTHLVGVQTSSLLEDHEGNLWITALRGGVYQLTPMAKKLRYSSASDEVVSGWVRLLETDPQGNILVGYDEGTVLRFSHFDDIPGETDFLWSAGRRMRAMSQEPNGKWWLLSESIDYPIAELQGDQVHPFDFALGSPKTCLVAHNGDLFMGFSKGMLHLPKDSIKGLPAWEKRYRQGRKNYASLHEVRSAFLEEYRILNQSVYGLCQTPDHTIWMGTHNGLFKHQSGKLSPLEHDDPFFSSDILDIEPAGGNGIFLATQGNGIGYFNGDTVITLKASDGLISNLCNVLYNDGDSILWVGTSFGLSRVPWTGIRFQSDQIQNYTAWEGLPSNQVEAILKVRDTVLVGTTRGLAWFPDTQEPPLAPNILINRVNIMEQEVAIQDAYELSHEQNYLRIDFTGLFFKNPDGISYEFMMEGIDRDWVSTQQGKAAYPNLNPGSYVFKVRAVHLENQIRSEEAQLNFLIRPAIIQTNGFKVLGSFAIVGVLILLIFSRLRNLKKRADWEKELLESRQRALQAQMNPNFIVNTLNAIHGSVQTGDISTAGLYLEKFKGLIRTLPELSHHSFISLKQERSFLKNYLEISNFRFHNRFSLEVKPMEGPQNYKLPPLLIQPFLEDAILEGLVPREGKGTLTVEFQKLETWLLCTILDNGVHRDKDGQSAGLKNVRDRISLINRENGSNMYFQIEHLRDPNGKEVGTSLSLYIPLF